MKTLLFFISLLLVLNVNADESITTKVNESTYQFVFNGNDEQSSYYGMSFAVYYNNQKFILTNRHVCLGEYKENFGQHLSEKRNVTFYNNYGEISYSYYIREAVSFLDTDLCALPYKDSLKNMSFYNIQSINYKQVYSYFELSKIKFYTLNYFSHVKEINGESLPIFDLKINTNKSMFSLNTHVTTLKIIQGDSGSPVFDSNDNFIGLVFANNRSHKKIEAKGSKLEIRKNIEKTVLHGFITPEKDTFMFLDYYTTFGGITQIKGLNYE